MEKKIFSLMIYAVLIASLAEGLGNEGEENFSWSCAAGNGDTL